MCPQHAGGKMVECGSARERGGYGPCGPVLLGAILWLLVLGFLGATQAIAAPLVSNFLSKVSPGDLVPGAQAFGPLSDRAAAVPALKDGQTIGWVFLTSDFVSTTGYSGKPIHVLVGISPDAVLTGARLVKHSEPIVLVGIPEARIKQVTEKYAALDLKAIAHQGANHKLDIVSGATVTIMVIDDSIVRAGIAVSKALELGNFTAKAPPVAQRSVRRDVNEVLDWSGLVAQGGVKNLRVDVATINADFAALGDPRTGKNTEPGPDTDQYIDIWTGLVSQPSIGRSLLGVDEFANLKNQLGPGDEAIAIMGAGRWSFKGSGYVRGGIFDRFQLIQGDMSHRFRDREHKRLAGVAAAGAPDFAETDIFIVPAKAGFNPASRWRLQFLAHRAVGPIEKRFLTFELAYALPQNLIAEAPAPAPADNLGATPNMPPSMQQSTAQVRDELWLKIWQGKKVQVVALGLALAVLTVIFFFQMFFTRHERLFTYTRTGFLIFTLFYLGWYANAQLSVVNVMAIFSSLVSDFRWESFLMDPLIFILWFAVAAALLFWGRGAYCGWLCPFGALQELSNKLARLLKVPQIVLPWGLHERLWALKYMIFLALFGLSLYSIELAEHYAEVEPFKTAIILKFARPAPYVLFALAMLVPGLFIERFYCRYLCPLGAGLAIPARLHMFRWLRRYKECGSPCQVCAKECPVEAIHPTGEINPNECISCLNCQVLYQHTAKCPVVVARVKKRERFERQMGRVAQTHDAKFPQPNTPATRTDTRPPPVQSA